MIYIICFPKSQLNQLPMEFSCTIFGFLALFLFSLLWISKNVHNRAKKRDQPPEAKGAWPLIGHLPLLGGPQPPHITLGNMADKYGPLFRIKLGVHPALVVSSWDMAKQCLTTNDKAFANRPKALVGEILAYDFAMFGFSPYGTYWRQVRKTATLELLSNHRLELLKHMREAEVKACTKLIYDLWDKNKGRADHKVLVEMSRWFGDVTLNVMFRMVLGRRFLGENYTVEEREKNERCRKAVRDFFKLAGEFVMSDAVPFLRCLDLGGHEKAMKKTAKELDGLVQGWLEEHKQKSSSSNTTSELDFMDMMLSAVDGDSRLQGFHGHTTATITKATCLAVLLGGTDTTTVTLTWAVSLLLNNREALRKAQDELDNNVGRERQVNESDLQNLVYLQAIVKETLRLYPAAPLSLIHESTEDCTVGSYHVPAGTRLILNLSKIQRDPNAWLDPFLFQPERFLTTHKDFDVRGQNFELIPFGSGRRMCPGISLALQIMHLTLAHLLHGFEITTSNGEAVDMRETSGLTNLKETPLEVLLRPRLPAKLYDH